MPIVKPVELDLLTDSDKVLQCMMHHTLEAGLYVTFALIAHALTSYGGISGHPPSHSAMLSRRCKSTTVTVSFRLLRTVSLITRRHQHVFRLLS